MCANHMAALKNAFVAASISLEFRGRRKFVRQVRVAVGQRQIFVGKAAFSRCSTLQEHTMMQEPIAARTSGKRVAFVKRDQNWVFLAPLATDHRQKELNGSQSGEEFLDSQTRPTCVPCAFAANTFQLERLGASVRLAEQAC